MTSIENDKWMVIPNSTLCVVGKGNLCGWGMEDDIYGSPVLEKLIFEINAVK